MKAEGSGGVTRPILEDWTMLTVSREGWGGLPLFPKDEPPKDK
ncbi:hypothetical protein [Jiella flava]|nr:hypothetical protein [Jiella flava]